MNQPSKAIIARALLGQGQAQDGRLVMLFEGEDGDTEALVVPPALLPDMFQMVAVTAGAMAEAQDGASFLIPVAGLALARARDGQSYAVEVRTVSGARLRLGIEHADLAILAQALTAAVNGDSSVRH